MNFLLFLAPFSWGTQKREAAAPKASGCFMGGTCAVREEPGKQNTRSCRAQELARSRAQENARQKKRTYRNLWELGCGADSGQAQDGKLSRVTVCSGEGMLRFHAISG